MPVHKVAMLTAGGHAPCLSSAVGGLIERYTDVAPDVEILGYLYGFQGVLKGESLAVTPEVRAKARLLHRHGGSPLGTSRIKLTNVADCVRRGLVEEGADPLKVAADRLARDGVTILHTIGGDDTNITAAGLAAYLAGHGYELTVVGLPKTIDNDILPVRQTLGALTAAEQGAIFFENVVNEHSSSPRMLVIHEVMGRHCGWLTAATAHVYRRRLANMEFLPAFNLDRAHKDIDAVFLPEMEIDIGREASRLRRVMDVKDCANVFLSEGACLDQIVADKASRGEAIDRDPFGHVKLDKINVGAWFAQRLADLVGAEKTLVQKSGYFVRSAAPNGDDLRLIQSMVDVAVECGLRGQSGVVGHDEEHGGLLRAIEFPRIKGGRRFDMNVDWFRDMLTEIGQSAAPKATGEVEEEHAG
jgi:pyrophosphate--fructose-6-phosphate 1-phosphotransferase